MCPELRDKHPREQLDAGGHSYHSHSNLIIGRAVSQVASPQPNPKDDEFGPREDAPETVVEEIAD
jgi:hypothetical protein